MRIYKKHKYFFMQFFVCNYKSISIAIYQKTKKKKKMQWIQHNKNAIFFFLLFAYLWNKCSLKKIIYWETFYVTKKNTTMHFMYEVYFLYSLYYFFCVFAIVVVDGKPVKEFKIYYAPLKRTFHNKVKYKYI